MAKKDKNWWAKHNWLMKPSDKINLEINGKTKFIGSPKYDSILAVLPTDYEKKITAFVTTEDLRKLIDGEVEEVECEINQFTKLVLHRTEYVRILRGDNIGEKYREREREKGFRP